jgi:hypothetical protein
MSTPVFTCRPDSTPQQEVSPWDFPTDVGVTRNNRGAHGGLKEAGRNDAAKKRRLVAHARQEGRYTR